MGRDFFFRSGINQRKCLLYNSFFLLFFILLPNKLIDEEVCEGRIEVCFKL